MSTALPEIAGGGGRTDRRGFVPGMIRPALDRIESMLRSWLTPERLHALSASRIARPIARSSARAVFDVVAGFTHSQVLVALVRLGVVERLARDTATVEALAAATGLPMMRMHLLLDAGVAIDVLHRRFDGTYTTTVAGRAIQGDPGVLAMIEHNQLLYRDLVDPLRLLRGEGETELSGFWPYGGDGERAALGSPEARRYSDLMAASQSFIAHEILDAVDFSHRRRLLDVGGGTGAFLEAVGARHSHLALALADLPAVAHAAAERLAGTSVASRVQCHGVDFFAGELPEGADVVSLVRILHDHDDAQAMQLLRAVRRALPIGATLLIAEPMRGEPGAERIGDVYFPLYFLAMGRGRARSRAEIVDMCREAGFERFVHPATHVPLQTSVILAEAG